MTKKYKDIDCIADIGTKKYKAYAKISQSGVHAYMHQMIYAKYCLYFGAVLLFLMIVKKVFYVYTDYRAREGLAVKDKRFNFPIVNKLSAFSRWFAYKRLPLMFSRITGLPPSFGTLFLLFASTLFLLCYSFIPHFWYRSCRGFGSPPLAIRTGMMVMALTPFLYIMSGKTNFISGVTGISYEKLNVFHQGLGWGSLFLSLVHTIPFLIQDVQEGGAARLHHQWNHKRIYRNGVPPLVLLFFLCFAGSRFIRERMYEAFWHLHWIMGLAYFGTLAWHIDVGREYLWGTLGFWGAQILYRIVLKSPFKPNTFAFKHKEATVKALPNDLYEISVPIKSHYEFFWKPGQHIFIRFMYGIHTLDNHPFSVLTVPRPNGNTNLKLVVRPQRGLTKKIYDDILNEKNLEKKYKVYIDGAYGGMNRDPLAFDKLIMVSSGTGVAVTLPFMTYIAQNLSNPTNCVKSTEFIWVINSPESLQWVKDQIIELLNMVILVDAKLLEIFNFEIFVTNSRECEPTLIENREQLSAEVPVGTKKASSLTIEDKSDHDIDASSQKDHDLSDSSSSLCLGPVTEENYQDYLNIYLSQKPQLEKYVESSTLLNKNAIIVSGTGSLQVAVGNAASKLQRKVYGKAGAAEEVYLHTENFGW